MTASAAPTTSLVMQSSVPTNQRSPDPARSASLQTLAAAPSDSSPPRRTISTVKMLLTSALLGTLMPERRAWI